MLQEKLSLLINEISFLRQDINALRKDIRCLDPGKRRQKRFYSVKEAAGLLEVHEETLRRWIRAGSFPAAKLGKGGDRDHYLIEADDIEQYLQSNAAREYSLSVVHASPGGRENEAAQKTRPANAAT
jgi:excisionase family DNA binding protein